jgi:hypothetical protein
MRIAECGMRNLSNAECGMMNAESSEMRNAEPSAGKLQLPGVDEWTRVRREWLLPAVGWMGGIQSVELECNFDCPSQFLHL